MEIVTQNIARLNHLLKLFSLSKDDLLRLLNEGKKKQIGVDDIFSEKINVRLLKKIDAFFIKGLAYYVDPAPLIESDKESIFFRKDHFNASLTFGAKQIVNKFEEEKIAFDTLLKLSDITKERALPVYKLTDNPSQAAHIIRGKIYPNGKNDDKLFLKELISILAENSVIVFEFVETHNKKHKANINGFYLSPNAIVLKWQKYTKREIFTLAHEIGHFLLNEEEIDDNINSEVPIIGDNEVEKWCNDFAFNFLAGQSVHVLNNLTVGDASNNYHESVIDRISKETHLSRLALYTSLLYANKLSKNSYRLISNDIKAAIKKIEDADKKKFEADKLDAESNGRTFKISTPKPILSPFYVQTLQAALYNGIVNEFEFCQRLNIKPNKLEAYLA